MPAPLAQMASTMRGMQASAQFLTNAWTGLSSLVKGVWEAIKNGAIALKDAIVEKWEDLKAWWADFKEKVAEKWEALKVAFMEAVAKIKEKWDELKLWWEEFKEKVEAKITLIKEAVMGIVDAIVEKWDALKTWWEDFKAGIEEKWESLKATVGSLFDNFNFPEFPDWKGMFEDAKAALTGFFDNLDIPEMPDWGQMFEDAKATLSGFFDELNIPAMPEWLTLTYWETLIADFDIGDMFDFEWSDILPDWSWDDIIPDALADFFDIDLGEVWEGITGVFETLLGSIKELFNTYVRPAINSILEWDPPVIPGGTIGEILGQSPIPELAEGGIVTSPTLALIGEAGPEAVVPLDRGGGYGGTYNMTFNLSGMTDRTDKRRLAREVADAIAAEMRRNAGGATRAGRAF